MTKRLPADATLRTIVNLLANPEEFVRAVFANMRGGRSDTGVRIALNSNPKWPDYCLEMHFEEQNEIGDWEVVGASIMAEISGRSHKELPYTDHRCDRAWSSAVMSWEDVQLLIGELRGFTSPQGSQVSLRMRPTST